MSDIAQFCLIPLLILKGAFKSLLTFTTLSVEQYRVLIMAMDPGEKPVVYSRKIRPNYTSNELVPSK